MDINSALFVVSNTDLDKCPKPDKPEYAFIGRSNVGKSSLINLLTGFSSLAKVSGKPGKTRLINHFLINKAWYLVDLPGYGWAKITKTERQKWKKMINGYLTKRENLQCVFVLIDSRHEPQEIDLEFLRWLGSEEIPFSKVFTKSDKQSRTKSQALLKNYKSILLEEWEELPETFISSSVSKEGKDQILNFIDQIYKKFTVD